MKTEEEEVEVERKNAPIEKRRIDGRR